MQSLFPREVTSRAPRITLTGRESVWVEQHGGLVAYSQEQIDLRTASGMVRIAGEKLHITAYTAQEVQITGQIDGVTVYPEGGRR